MNLPKYALRRIIISIPVLLGVLAFTFALMKLACPDEVIVYQRLHLPFTQEDFDREYSLLGFDKPIIIQFLVFVRLMFTGDWGTSMIVVMDSSCKDIIFQRLPRTLEIAIICYIISTYIGLKLGVITGSNRGNRSDKVTRIITYLGISVPPFVLAIFFSQMAAFEDIRLFPFFGYKTPGIGTPTAVTNGRIIDCILTGNWVILGDYLYHLIVPVSAMIVFQLSIIFRQTRSSMIDVLQSDYIRTAYAKGCKEKTVNNKHAFKNALGPSISVIGMGFPKIFAGFIVLEVAFDLPGIGQLFFLAFRSLDYALIIPIIFICAIVVLIFNFLADITYAMVDPRVRLT